MLALCWSWASDRHGDHIQVVEMIPIFVSTATTWRCGITSVTWWDPITDVTVPHGPKSTGLCFGCLVARNGCHSNTTSLAAAQRCPTHLGPQKTCRVAPSNCFVHTIPARASPSQLSAKKVGICWDHQNHQHSHFTSIYDRLQSLTSRLSVNDPALLRMNVFLQEAVKPGRALFREQTATSLDKFLDLKSWTKRQLFIMS